MKTSSKQGGDALLRDNTDCHLLTFIGPVPGATFPTYLRTGCASLLRGTGMPPAEGALGRGRPLLMAVVPAGLVRVALLILLEGFAGTGFCTTGGPGEEVVCVNCVLSWLPEPEPWLLNAFTGCRRANGDGAAGERNLPGEGTAYRRAKESQCFQRSQVPVKPLPCYP